MEKILLLNNILENIFFYNKLDEEFNIIVNTLSTSFIKIFGEKKTCTNIVDFLSEYNKKDYFVCDVNNKKHYIISLKSPVNICTPCLKNEEHLLMKYYSLKCDYGYCKCDECITYLIIYNSYIILKNKLTELSKKFNNNKIFSNILSIINMNSNRISTFLLLITEFLLLKKNNNNELYNFTEKYKNIEQFIELIKDQENILIYENIDRLYSE